VKKKNTMPLTVEIFPNILVSFLSNLLLSRHKSFGASALPLDSIVRRKKVISIVSEIRWRENGGATNANALETGEVETMGWRCFYGGR